MKVNYELKIEVLKDGKVVKTVKKKGNGFLKNFMALLCGLLFDNIATANIRDTTGTYYDARVRYYAADDTFRNAHAEAGEGITDRGILVGTGTTPPAPTDYSLESLIEHGTGAGQMYYYATNVVGISVSDNEISFDVVREIANQSGADITVYEIGLAIYYYYVEDGTPYNLNVLLIRDVISDGITVPNGQSLRITYRIKATT